MKTIKSQRQKIGNYYSASGYGRGRNKRNVYLINGKCYAYHLEYALQSFKPLKGDLEGYIPVNYSKSFGTFHTIGIYEKHGLLIKELTT